jgi:predicted transcriptional regulator YdeE
MNTIKMERFTIVGIAVRTSNRNGQAAQDIPALWQRFLAEQVAARIPGKVDETVYSVYTEYEGDYTQPYTTVLGCRVYDAAQVPEDMKAITIDAGRYTRVQAKGSLDAGIVYQAWTGIWNSDMPRAYTADYEVYGPKAQDPANAEVDIFIALK